MVASVVVAVVGVVALAGWLREIESAMQANTALAFVLLGVATVLLVHPSTARWVRIVRRVAAALALAAGGLTLTEYVTGLHLGIDQLLVHDLAADGLMPPVTALGLTTCSAALLLLDLGVAGSLAQALALAGGTLGFLNLVGYVYSLRRATLAGYTEIPIHTAFALAALAAGILLARPRRGFVTLVLADTAAGVVVRRLLPVVIAAPLILGWLVERGRGVWRYSPEFGMALFVVSTSVALTLVVWSAASALQRADTRRRRAETALQRADAEVGRVVARTVELTDANKALVEMTARLRTLERLNRLVSSSLDFDAVLVAIASAAADLTATPVVSFWLVDESAERVTVRAWSDAAAGADFPYRAFAFGEGAVGRVASTRTAVHTPDVFATAAPILALEWCRAHGLSSFSGIPVHAQDRLLAVLALSRRSPLVLGEDDQELLASFVAQAAVAIHNACLFAEAQEGRRAAEATVVAEREAEGLRAVAKLAHAAAHEINNPLAVIVAHLDLLQKRYDGDAETVRRLARARAACARIVEMVGHMGRITRLELSEQSPNLPAILDLRRSSTTDSPPEPALMRADSVDDQTAARLEPHRCEFAGWRLWQALCWTHG